MTATTSGLNKLEVAGSTVVSSIVVFHVAVAYQELV